MKSKIRFIIPVLAIIPTHFILHFIFKTILLTERGMDLSDEGLYLLSAKSSSNYSTYGWPSGWITGILYDFSKQNVSEFRIAGAEVLFILSYAVTHKFLSSRKISSQKFDTKIFLLNVMVSTSSIYFYSGMLRSPGYNWLNLVAILISILGILNFENDQKKHKSYLILSVGLIFGLLSKPSTSCLFFIIFIIFCRNRKFNSSIKLLFFVGVEILILILFKIFPLNFYHFLLQPFSTPSLTQAQTPLTSLYSLIAIPIDIFHNSKSIPLIVLSLLILNYFYKQKLLKEKFVFILIFFLITGILLKIFIGDFPIVFADERIAYLWITITFIAFIFTKRKKIGEINFKNHLLIFCSVIAFGFGSSNNFIPMSGVIIFFYVLYSVYLASGIDRTSLRKMLLFLILTVNIIGIFNVIIDGINHPYRSSNLIQAKAKTQIADSSHYIYLDKETSEEITELQNSADRNGFNQNTVIINLVWPWKPGVSYLLGGVPPKSIIFAIFQSQNTFNSAKYRINEIEPKSTFDYFWLIKSSEDQIPTGDKKIENDLLRVISGRSNFMFPADFQLVAKTANYELWRPTPP